MQALGSERKRRKLGFVHDGCGHRVEWGDAFVTVFGMDWRCKRDQCTKESEWMACFPQFESHLCDLWRLFKYSADAEAPVNDMAQTGPKRRRVATHPLDQLRDCHGDGAPDILWEGPTQRIVFITDCKPLV